jgi:hypothetical protein
MRMPVTSLKFMIAIGMMVTMMLVPTGWASAQHGPGCTLSPLTLPLFEATPAVDVAATPVGGEDASFLDQEAATVAMEQIVVCSNSGDPAVAYAIFTERYLATLYADPGETYQPAFEERLNQGALQPDRNLVLDEVQSVTPLADGRVEVVATISGSGVSYTDTFILAMVGGEWLIDDVTLLQPAP